MKMYLIYCTLFLSLSNSAFAQKKIEGKIIVHYHKQDISNYAHFESYHIKVKENKMMLAKRKIFGGEQANDEIYYTYLNVKGEINHEPEIVFDSIKLDKRKFPEFNMLYDTLRRNIIITKEYTFKSLAKKVKIKNPLIENNTECLELVESSNSNTCLQPRTKMLDLYFLYYFVKWKEVNSKTIIKQIDSK